MTKLRFAAVALVAVVSTTTLSAQEKPDRRQSHQIPVASSIEPEGVVVAAPHEHAGARMEITGLYELRRTEVLKPGQTAKKGSNVGSDGAGTDLRHKVYVAESAYRGPRYLASAGDLTGPASSRFPAHESNSSPTRSSLTI